MVKKKNVRKKNYGSSTNNTIIVVAIIFLLFMAFKSGVFNPQIEEIKDPVTLGQLNLLSPLATGDCKISLNKDVYCLNALMEGEIKGSPNTEYLIGMNKDNTGWGLWGSGVTNANGYLLKQGSASMLGTYQVRAISDSCTTNLVEVDVISCSQEQEEQAVIPVQEPVSMCCTLNGQSGCYESACPEGATMNGAFESSDQCMAICSNIPDTNCEDTDGGFDVYEYGVCMGVSGVGSWDFCSGGMSGGTLAEQSCDQDTKECVQTWHTCQDGYFCVQGACQALV